MLIHYVETTAWHKKTRRFSDAQEKFQIKSYKNILINYQVLLYRLNEIFPIETFG